MPKTVGIGLHRVAVAGKCQNSRRENFHENAHDVSMKEKRGDLLIVRAMPIHSWEMGVSGECDVVEFHKVKDGIQLAGKKGFIRLFR